MRTKMLVLMLAGLVSLAFAADGGHDPTAGYLEQVTKRGERDVDLNYLRLRPEEGAKTLRRVDQSLGWDEALEVSKSKGVRTRVGFMVYTLPSGERCIVATRFGEPIGVDCRPDEASK